MWLRRIYAFLCDRWEKRNVAYYDTALTATGYPWDVRRISWRDVRISHNSPQMSLHITWTSQGYRHFLHSGYNPVGLKYPAQDIRIYNEINNDSKVKNLSYYQYQSIMILNYCKKKEKKVFCHIVQSCMGRDLNLGPSIL